MAFLIILALEKRFKLWQAERCWENDTDNGNRPVCFAFNLLRCSPIVFVDSCLVRLLSSEKSTELAQWAYLRGAKE